MSEDLPLPLFPTNAVVFQGTIVSEKFLKQNPLLDALGN